MSYWQILIGHACGLWIILMIFSISNAIRNKNKININMLGYFGFSCLVALPTSGFHLFILGVLNAAICR
jgi:hypothetical protein